MNEIMMMVNKVMLIWLYHLSIHLNDKNYSNEYLYDIHFLILNFLNQMNENSMVQIHINNDYLLQDDNEVEMFVVHHHQSLESNLLIRMNEIY